MRKAFLPLLASLLLCGTAAGALIATNAKAQAPTRNPVMLAQNTETPQPGAPDMGRMRRFSPADIAQFRKARCEDQYARATGRMAYLETRLKLTGAQQPLFSAWKAVRLDIAKRRADACAQRSDTDRDTLTPVDRMARMEDRLKQRVADLDAERPAFTALYGALTPDQRQALSPDRRGMMRRMMGRGRGMGPGMTRGARPMNAPPPGAPQ